MSNEHRGQGCSCPAHRPRSEARGGWSAVALPVLACAFCPVCLGTYAQVFSALGVGFHLGEHAHTVLLLVAIGMSLGVSGWRSIRARRGRPLVVAAAGCAVLFAGHLVEARAVELVGMAILVGGAIAEQRRLRVVPRAAEHRPSSAWTPTVTPITIERAPITSASALRTYGGASIQSDAPAAPRIVAIPMMDPVPNNEL